MALTNNRPGPRPLPLSPLAPPVCLPAVTDLVFEAHKAKATRALGDLVNHDLAADGAIFLKHCRARTVSSP